MMDLRGAVVLGGAHGALALARSLGPSGVPVFHVTDDSRLPGSSRHVKRQIGWPGPHDEGAIPFLLKAAEDQGWQGDLLVPAGDAEVELVSRHIDRLAGSYTVCLPPWDALRWLCDKPLLYQRAAELGIATPRTYEPPGDAPLEGFDLEFPVILKPNMGGGDTAFSKAKVIRVDDRTALDEAYKHAAAEIGADNVVVQELIPGGGEHQFSYAALWENGKPVAEFTARRTRQYPVDFGYTSTFVEIVEEPGVVEAARTILASISHHGLVEVEFKRDQRDDSLRLLDVNPRPWSWFGLCSAAGVDLGTMLWRLANDRPNAPAAATPGTAWMYLARDAVAATSLMARRDIGLGGYLRSFGRVRAWATFARSDPRPGLIDLPLTGWRVLTRRILKAGHQT